MTALRPSGPIHSSIEPMKAAIAIVEHVGLVIVGTLILISRAIAAWQEFRDSVLGANKALAVTIREWSTAGAQLVAGFVLGLRSGVDQVRSAVAGLAGAATGGLREALGIHSPSRVFAGLGRQVPRGFAEGIDGESGEAGDAAERMAGASTGGAEGPNLASLGSRRVEIRIESIVINGGVEEGQEAADTFVDRVAAAFEEALAELGRPVTPGAAVAAAPVGNTLFVDKNLSTTSCTNYNLFSHTLLYSMLRMWLQATSMEAKSQLGMQSRA